MSDSVLIIHIGAGQHSVKLTAKYRKLFKISLKRKDVISASRIVEKSYLTNTGYASSLDRSGNVTSDASIIYTDNGCVKRSLTLVNIDDVVSPTAKLDSVLKQLDIDYAEGSVNRKFGLSKPIVLEYKSYTNHVKSTNSVKNREEHGDCDVADKVTNMIPDNARENFEKFETLFGIERDNDKSKRSSKAKRDVEDLEKEKDSKKSSKRQNISNSLNPSVYGDVEDTVGYIELVSDSKLCVASSSGGNFFRLPGRISCAGVLGAGIGYTSSGKMEICCMCSGNGDDIIAMNLASYLCDTMMESLESDVWPDLGSLLVSRICRKGISIKKTAVDDQLKEIVYVGVIMVIRTPTIKRLVFCHSTESFYFAFRSEGKIETVLSRSNVPMGDFLYGEYNL